MDIGFVVDNINSLAVLIGSLIAIGSALMFVLNKTILEPRERRENQRRSEESERMRKTVKDGTWPIARMVEEIQQSNKLFIEQLNKLKDIEEQNMKIIEEHERRLINHDRRIIVLETRQDIILSNDEREESDGV